MKRIEAYSRVTNLENVRNIGISYDQVRGFRWNQGRADLNCCSIDALNLIPKMRIAVVVPDDLLDSAIGTDPATCKTGEMGDGKIFVTKVLDAFRIRPGQRRGAALS